MLATRRDVSMRDCGHGGLASTGKAVDLKSTGPRGPWGFESLALRHFLGTCEAFLSSSRRTGPLNLAVSWLCPRLAIREHHDDLRRRGLLDVLQTQRDVGAE